MAATALKPTYPAGVIGVNRGDPSWRWHTPLQDGLWLVGVVWTLPLAVLVIGMPVAIAIVLLLWAGRSALGAF